MEIELTDFKIAVFDIFKVTEVKDIEEKVLDCVLSHDEQKYEAFLKLVHGDLDDDPIRALFQYYLADRDNKKQDFTPKCLSNLVLSLAGSSDLLIDECAGIGSIAIYDKLKRPIHAIEIDDSAIPFLLFNLAIRNLNATVYQGDAIKKDYKAIYKLTPEKRFSLCDRV